MVMINRNQNYPTPNFYDDSTWAPEEEYGPGREPVDPDMEGESWGEEEYPIEGPGAPTPILTAKEYKTELLKIAQQIREDQSLTALQKNEMMTKINKLLLDLRKIKDNATPGPELLSQIETFQFEMMERETQNAEETQAGAEELYAKLEEMKGQIEAKEGPFAYLSEEQLKEYTKKIDQWINTLDLGIEKVEKIADEVETFEKELQENQVGNPEFAEEDTPPSKIENDEASYNEGDVSLHAWHQDQIKTHQIKTTGTVDIYTEEGDQVKITKNGANNYLIEVTNSDGSVETFVVDKRTAQINLHANFENVTCQDGSGTAEAYLPGMDAKIYVDGEESIEPDYQSIDFLKQLDDLIPEKNAKDIMAAVQKHFGDLIPSDYKDAEGNLNLAGLKRAIKEGILPPKDAVAWGPKVLAFFLEIDLALQNQYTTLANSKGWDAADPLTERLVKLFNAFGIQARDPGNSGNAEDDIEILVNGQWTAIDVVAGRGQGWAAQFLSESGRGGSSWDSPVDGMARGAAVGAVVGLAGGPAGIVGGAVAGAVVGGVVDVGEDVIDSIF